MNIVSYIPVGKENAVDRFKLVELTGMNDRRVRRAIQVARENGELIINAQDGRGYYRATESDTEALLAQYKQDTARALSILKRRKAVRSLLKESGVSV